MAHEAKRTEACHVEKDKASHDPRTGNVCIRLLNPIDQAVKSASAERTTVRRLADSKRLRNVVITHTCAKIILPGEALRDIPNSGCGEDTNDVEYRKSSK